MFIRAGELLAQRDDNDLDYAVEGLLPLTGTAVLAGRPKSGKSTLALNLALAVARGEPFLGRETRKGPALYCARRCATRLESRAAPHRYKERRRSFYMHRQSA